MDGVGDSNVGRIKNPREIAGEWDTAFKSGGDNPDFSKVNVDLQAAFADAYAKGGFEAAQALAADINKEIQSAGGPVLLMDNGRPFFRNAKLLGIAGTDAPTQETITANLSPGGFPSNYMETPAADGKIMCLHLFGEPVAIDGRTTDKAKT